MSPSNAILGRRLGALILAAGAGAAGCGDETSGEALPPPSRAGWDPTEAFAGYTMFAPLESSTTYLIDMDGQVVHSWPSEHIDVSQYLMDDGSILRCSAVKDPPVFKSGGQAGRIERITWDGETVWQYLYATEDHLQHHDIEPLPNGNVLFVAWERKTREQALAAGRDPELLTWDTFWPDTVIEIKPVLPDGAEIVWEWHAWDHLIQDFDPAAPQFGDPAAHPGRIDVNGDRVPEASQLTPDEEAEEIAMLEELGYAGDGDPKAAPETKDEAPPPDEASRRRTADWLHTNAIDYHPGHDWIVVSARRFHEVWVIDHATTTEQARGSAGDLLYRWGNPKAYGRGRWEDRQLYGQHNVQWIPPGHLGAGNLILFNNGNEKDGRGWSSIEEFTMPIDAQGRIVGPGDGAFGPAAPAWRYEAEDKPSFFSSFISGTSRLPNGNTLICSGDDGWIFEVTPAGKTVWEYTNELGEVKEPDPEKPGDDPNRFRTALYRATRIAPDHPGLARLQPAR
ncbi:MAG TPA: aryl-sulfate sulfotransferase [Planctomycetota bacterium]